MADDRTHFNMTLRLAAVNWRKLEALSAKMGVPKTNVIAQAIQEMAERRGIQEPSDEKEEVTA
jgi:hypothetical protein